MKVFVAYIKYGIFYGTKTFASRKTAENYIRRKKLQARREEEEWNKDEIRELEF